MSLAKTLLVEGFPRSVMDHQLYSVFAAVGKVLLATIVRSHTGGSLRVGFGEMASEEEAIKVKETVHRTLFKGQFLIVNFERAKLS